MGDIGVAIVGYGLAGRYFHAPFIKQVPDFSVVAIMTRSPQRQEQARGDFPEAKIYTDFDELLADDSVDLVSLATPHDTHEPLAVAALQAGKHVVTDKIMAPDAAAARRMLEAAERAGRMLTVLQNRRWDSDFLTARLAIEQGLLGELWSVEVYVDCYRQPSDAWRWRRSAGGGRFRDWGAHLFDQAMVLTGFPNPAEVKVWADWQYRYGEVDVETEVVTHMVFPTGLRYTIHISVQHRVERWERRFTGTDGTLVIYGQDPQEAALRSDGIRVIAGSEEAKIAADSVVYAGREGAQVEIVPGNWLEFWRNVADALQGRAELAVKPEQVVKSIELIDKAAEFDPWPKV